MALAADPRAVLLQARDRRASVERRSALPPGRGALATGARRGREGRVARGDAGRAEAPRELARLHRGLSRHRRRAGRGERDRRRARSRARESAGVDAQADDVGGARGPGGGLGGVRGRGAPRSGAHSDAGARAALLGGARPRGRASGPAGLLRGARVDAGEGAARAAREPGDVRGRFVGDACGRRVGGRGPRGGAAARCGARRARCTPAARACRAFARSSGGRSRSRRGLRRGVHFGFRSRGPPCLAATDRGRRAARRGDGVARGVARGDRRAFRARGRGARRHARRSHVACRREGVRRVASVRRAARDRGGRRSRSRGGAHACRARSGRRHRCRGPRRRDRPVARSASRPRDLDAGGSGAAAGGSARRCVAPLVCARPIRR